MIFSNMISYADYHKRIYKAFISGNMIEWEKIIMKMEKKRHKSLDFKIELINYQIGYIGYCVGEKRYKEARKYIKIAEKNIEILESNNYKASKSITYRASINGLRIGMNNFMALFLGPQILKDTKDALDKDPENTDALILMGNSKFYMAKVLGGSVQAAIEYYSTAEKIMVRNKNLKHNWNYLSLLSLIAHAYEKVEKLDMADKYYKKILTLEPDYMWIKNDIYPKFLKQYEK